MTDRKTSSKLQNNDDVVLSQKIAPPMASTATPRRESLLPFRASTVQVIKELDQLLTMDTLIYFVQAAIELFLLSFRFAYQQPIQKSIKQRSAHRRPVHRPPKNSPRQPVWEKTLQPAVQTRSQHSDQSSFLVSAFPKSTIVATVAAVVDPVAPPRETAPPPPTSDTGSVALAPRPQRPVHSQIINSGLPPPPSLPKLPPSCLLPRVTIPPPPSSTIFITDDKTTTSSPPSIRYLSQSFQKPPRRKPVQSNHVRKSSAKFERPPADPPEQPSSPIIPEDRVAPHSEDRSAEGSVEQKEESTAVNSNRPPLARKSSAKFIRHPLPSSQPPQPDLHPSVGPSLPSQLTEQVFVEQSPKPTDIPGKPLIRKSSAKFNRPQIQVPNFEQLPQVQLSPFTFQPPSIVSPVQEQNQAIEPSPQSKQTEHSSTETGTIEPPPTESQPSESQSLQPQPSKERPVQLQLTTIEQSEAQDTDPQSIRGPNLEFPQSVEVRSIPIESTKVQPVEEHLQTPLQLEEPVPQRGVSQPKFSLFPPQPAIAVVQTNPEPRQPAQQEPNPVSESFPDLPPLILSNPRQPPPPPAIPRFPSPPKSIHRSPSPSSSRISSSPGSRRSQTPVSRRNVSMAAVTSNSEDFSSPTEIFTRPGTSPETQLSVFPQEWDQSLDENVFSANAPSNVPKTIISTTSDRRFSFHGSIASSSSADSPQQEFRERLSTSNLAGPPKHIRAVSTNSQYIPSPLPSPRARPHSAGSVSSGSEYVPPAFIFDNTHLKPGNAAALLSHAETLNLYRQNAKKAVDNPAIQYEFAIFMMDAARESTLDLNGVSPSQRDELLKEGLSILRRLADRGYPQAQYYLADCYSNGIGCKHNTPDLEKAFPLFVLAAKHGHVEASFRTALAYENAWGCRRDPLKAVQFLRKAASGNHPGAMLRLGKACLNSEFGMPNTQPVTVEGVNWLKRAVEAATPLYPNAPYELALLHEFGYKDVVFPDEAYAVQLFAKAADLGHPDAAYRLGDAYEYGRMGCPEDAGLSIHYYSQSARGGNASAMLSLCAWYMVGAEGVLEKSDEEAFAWAQRAAEAGLAKAEFATGYFLERGVGCKRDALEAWKYYVRAADHGDERAISRLRAGKDLNSDRSMIASSVVAAVENDKGSRFSVSDGDVNGGKRLSSQNTKMDPGEDAKAKDKDCVVM